MTAFIRHMHIEWSAFFTWWKKYKLLTIILVILSTITGIIGGGILIYIVNGGQPIIEKNIDTSMVKVVGDRINIYYKIDHIKECPISVSRYLWSYYNLNNRQIKIYVPLSNEFTTITSIGYDQEFILSLALPKNLWSGKWFLYSKTISQCYIIPFIAPTISESLNVPLDLQINNSDNNIPNNGEIVPNSAP